MWGPPLTDTQYYHNRRARDDRHCGYNHRHPVTQFDDILTEVSQKYSIKSDNIIVT